MGMLEVALALAHGRMGCGNVGGSAGAGTCRMACGDVEAVPTG